MARLKKNAVISGLSGQLGKDHYARHTKDGKTIISVKPDFSNRQFSEAQLEVQSDLKAASAYARVASKTNPIYGQIAKKKARKKVLMPIMSHSGIGFGHQSSSASSGITVTFASWRVTIPW